jgi:pimeloyl-ACP methyl ester carboxylesterase
MRPFVGTPTDYTKKEHWLSLPENPDKAVDLVFLYPSSCRDFRADVICAVDNKSMVKGAKRNFNNQATVFEPIANMFAPFWRQVNAIKLTKMSYEEIDAAEWAEPRTDVYAALDYYFENLNQGRPYFLAGHSQGSRMCYMVLSEYMAEHPDRYANMIAAYCLGDSLTKQYLKDNPHVKAAQGANDVGVVVSWNTEGPANKGCNSLVLSPGAIAINPLNWRIDDVPAPAELNLGSYMPRLLFPGLRKLPVNADAVLDLERGSVVVTEPKLAKCAITAIPGLKRFESVFGPQSYHGCDYSFFFLNIRENIRLRLEAWLERYAV